MILDDAHHYRKSDAILYVSKIQSRYMKAVEQCIADLQDKIPEEIIEDNDIPEELLEYCKKYRICIEEKVEQIKQQFGYAEYEIYENWQKIRDKVLEKM